MHPHLLALAWTHDVAVCFPARPCQYFTPLAGHVINLTSALTPLSQAIAVGLLVVGAVGLVLALLGLAGPKARSGPSPWLVLLSSALFVIGSVVSSAVDTRFGAISLIYGAEGPPGIDLVKSWPLVGIAGGATAFLGLLVLASTATIATRRLRANRGRP